LRHLETVHWSDERESQTGTYSCHRRPYDKIQNASQVEVRTSLNGDTLPAETFLVFRKEVQPPQEVIEELLQQVENDKDLQRIQKSEKKQQPVEVAFNLHEGSIIAPDNCVLFAYLPTKLKTDLRFLIQARYQTTDGRDNIQMDEPWNKWLVQETANFLPEILEQLKVGGLLKPTFFNVLPLKADNVPTEFNPITEALRKAMQGSPFVPTQDGRYAKTESVFYPHAEALRKLFDINWLHLNSSWLHPEIRDTRKCHRCFNVMREAGVKEIGVSQVLNWLEKQDCNWFSSRSEEWLHSMYVYLNSQKSELARIKKLPLVRLENGQHVCASNQLVFFPPDEAEAREEIEPFLNDLPILQSSLLEGETRNDIEAFLKNVGVRALRPEDLVREWICPKYLQSDKPSQEQNRVHVRYLFKVWRKVSGYAHRSLKEKVSKTPILRAYRGVRREASDFVAPCDIYLPQAYTSDDNLETYFSLYDGDIWFVDDAYLDSNSDPKGWLKFLKAIGAMDTPFVDSKKIPCNSENDQEFDKELDKRNIKRERTTQLWKTSIEDRYFLGLPEALDEIGKQREADFSRALWHLLVKVVKPPSPKKPWWSKESEQDPFFQGTYRWFHYKPRQKPFDATFYRQLKETAWLPDEQGNFHAPSLCFAPTPENHRVLGDSVVYLPTDFDITTESAKWLAEKLGVRLNANTESVLNYLQTLSSTEVSLKDVEPLYRFLYRPGAPPHEKFKGESLIFTSNPEPRWWRADEVFWENESHLFDNRRGYLNTDYPETLKPFFIACGVLERAAPLDYVRGIQEVASGEQAEDEKVRERVKMLYSRLWQSLQEPKSGKWKESEEWKQTSEGRCWLGKKGNKWGFFSPHELVLKDHPYIARLFEGKVPSWAFDGDLLKLAEGLGVEGCSQAEVEFCPEGDQEEDEVWSAKVRNLRPYIHAFLESPSLCEGHEKGKSVHVLDRLSVCLVEELQATYKLKGVSVTDPDLRLSFLDTTNQEVTLWLGLETNKDEYARFLGDALQEYFGVQDLGRFAEDLLTKDRGHVLFYWEQKGRRTDLCGPPPKVDAKESEEKPTESVDATLPDKPGSGGADSVTHESGHRTDSPSDIENINPPDEQFLDETGNRDADRVEVESIAVETPTVNENPEIDSGAHNSVTEGSETRTYTPGKQGISRPGGHSISTSSRKSGRGGHGGSGGGEESDEHRELKENLAAKPSRLGAGLKLVDIEHTFKSNDRVDILLKDSSGNPVTVEVETGFSSGAGRYVGVWQAVKYKHLAAVEDGLLCEEVRSMLAAPAIPDDVKRECKRLGIEPFEVPDKEKSK